MDIPIGNLLHVPINSQDTAKISPFSKPCPACVSSRFGLIIFLSLLSRVFNWRCTVMIHLFNLCPLLQIEIIIAISHVLGIGFFFFFQIYIQQRFLHNSINFYSLHGSVFPIYVLINITLLWVEHFEINPHTST